MYPNKSAACAEVLVSCHVITVQGSHFLYEFTHQYQIFHPNLTMKVKHYIGIYALSYVVIVALSVFFGLIILKYGPKESHIVIVDHEDTQVPAFGITERTVEEFVCDNDADCGEHGTCEPDAATNVSICVCDLDFTSTGGDVCNYRRKNPINTLMASFFGGVVGADWFFLSRGDGGYIAAGVFKLLTAGGCGIWALVDVIRVATETFPDGNGHRLIRWTDLDDL